MEQSMKLLDKTDAQIESWARKYEEAGKTEHPDYARLSAERTKRRQKKQKLSFERSLEHLKSCAIEGRFTSYGELAKASEVEWGQARHQLNGPKGHLDTLLDECRIKNLPLLTAICVNQENLQTGKLGEDALSGFADGARRLGIAVGDADEFHARCVAECFEWGRTQAI
jgi:hypothetical protein